MSDSKGMLRVFVAIHPPPAIVTVLSTVLAGLKSAVPRPAVRWAPAGNIHLTLRFIGNVPATDTPALEVALLESVKGITPFTLHLGKPGCFPNRRAPRVLWIGLGGGLDALARLQENVQRATAAWGEPEARDFHPHLTLGRVNSKRRPELQAIGEALDSLSLPTTEPWRVRDLHLMRSDLRPSGAVYSSLAQFSLTS